MSEDRRTWKCSLTAERARSIARTIAMEAAARESKAFAVVADETWKIADELAAEVERRAFGDRDEQTFDARVLGLAENMELLSLNASIEALKAEGGKGVAICADEIRKLSFDLYEACGGVSTAEPIRVPSPSRPCVTSLSENWFMAFSVGGLRLAENLRFVREVAKLESIEPYVVDGILTMRNWRLPLVDCHAKLGLPRPDQGLRVVIVNTDWREPRGSECALVIDPIAVNAVFKSRIGLAVEPENAGLAAGLVREAWDASDGSRLLFLDWAKLV